MSSFPFERDFDPNLETESQYLDTLYDCFREMLINDPLHWLTTGKTISFRREQEIDERHASFWHAVSGGSGNERDRILDHNRCLRIRWIRYLLDAFNDSYPSEENFCWWKSPDPRWRNKRFLISTVDFDYVVIIEERRNYVLFITAYYVEEPRRRQKFQDQHDQFWNGQEPTT